MPCNNCKYWSELVAQSIGGTPVEAMCLSPDQPSKYRRGYYECDNYVGGRAIDDPSLLKEETP